MAETIVVIGDSLLDRFYEGPIERISQEAPIPTIGVSTIYDVAGGAGNVAKNLAALGHEVRLVTLLGPLERDDAAFSLRERLEAEPYEVIVHGIHDDNFHTPLKNRVVDAEGRHVSRFDVEYTHKPLEKQVQQALVDEVIALLNRKRGNSPVACLVLSDYGKGVLSSDLAVKEILGEARRLRIPTVVDPKHANILRYSLATIITPNLEEAQTMIGNYDASAKECAEELIETAKEAGILGVYVKDGQEGGWLSQIREDGTVRLSLIPPYPLHEVFDGTGAGDVVTAILAHELRYVSGSYDNLWYELDTACRKANIAAGFSVTKAGTGFLDLVHYEQALADNGRLPQIKICSLPALKEIVEIGKDAGEKVVFTNGCFDILHPGHIKLLQTARAMGDLLVVGINGDASITRLKGKDRPYLSSVHRAKMLEALECVDAVVVFDEDTPEELIRAISPDVLVKGSDWKDDITKIAGADYVLECGGKVAFVELLPGFSTTKLMQRG